MILWRFAPGRKLVHFFRACDAPIHGRQGSASLLLTLGWSSARHVASWSEEQKMVPNMPNIFENQWDPIFQYMSMYYIIYIYNWIYMCVFVKPATSAQLWSAPRIGAAGPRYLSPAREVRGPDLVRRQGQQAHGCLREPSSLVELP